MQTNPIYAAQNDLILEELSNRWSEDVPIIYDMVCFIQDEFAEFIADLIGDVNEEGNMELVYSSSSEF